MIGKMKKDNISLQEAVTRLTELAGYEIKTEIVDLMDSIGRILAADVYAPIDNPPFDRSPIDGYALIASDIRSASREKPVHLKVIAKVCAGGFFSGKIQNGQAVRIMTGAPIPEGCDACIRQEDTDYGEDIVTIFTSLNAGDNYCRSGEDYVKGQRLLSEGTKLGYVEISLLASMGIEKVHVVKKPAIALFTTGDELVFPGSPLKPGKIYNSNLYGVASRLTELGYKINVMEQIPDNGDQAAKAIEHAAHEADVILTTGGVSVGQKDILHDVLRLLSARRLFWGIRMKPGMPTMASLINKTVMVSLSGNPFGALATFEVLVRPLLAKLSRDDSIEPKRKRAVLENSFEKNSSVPRYVRGVYFEKNSGLQENEAAFYSGRVAIPSGSHSSGILASMRTCNCLIEVPEGSCGLCSGSIVDIVLL